MFLNLSPLKVCLYNRLPMQAVTIGMIRVRNVYIQKGSFPPVTRSTKKIDSSPAKGRKKGSTR